MNKKLLIGIIVVILLVLAYFLFRNPAQAPQQEMPIVEELGDDTTGAISSDLEALDMGDLDAEFEAIDQDLQSL